MVYLYFAGAYCVSVYALWLVYGLLGWLHDRFLPRRRGGARRRPALSLASPVAVSTTSGTHVSAVYFSSPGEPGSASAGVAIRPTPPRPSSGTALGFSGTSLTVTDGLSIGDHGLRLRPADSDVA